MAPEQILGHTVDSRADLFAFGVLLYKMTTGRRPFVGQRRDATFKQVLEHEPPSPLQLNDDVPPRLDALMLRLLAKDPRV